MCQECEGKGNDYANALKDCDDKIKLETCSLSQVRDPVCVVEGFFRDFSKIHHVRRRCMNRKFYNDYSDDCKDKEVCAIAMCDKSRCKAVLPFFSWPYAR